MRSCISSLYVSPRPFFSPWSNFWWPFMASTFILFLPCGDAAAAGVYFLHVILRNGALTAVNCSSIFFLSAASSFLSAITLSCSSFLAFILAPTKSLRPESLFLGNLYSLLIFYSSSEESDASKYVPGFLFRSTGFARSIFSIRELLELIYRSARSL